MPVEDWMPGPPAVPELAVTNQEKEGRVMLKLKGQSESGKWVEFGFTQIDFSSSSFVTIRIDGALFDIDPATIQPADDKCECPFCGKSWKPFKVEMNKEAEL